MQVSINKEVLESFAFPASIIRCNASSYLMEAANSAYHQLHEIDPKNVTGKSLFDDEGNRLFSGREEIIKRCLDDVMKNDTPMSLTLYEVYDAKKIDIPSGIWYLEINPLRQQKGADYLILTFHNITTVLTTDKQGRKQQESTSKSDQATRHAEQLQNKVQKKQVQYRAAADELDNFVYSVSHDLRAPLRRIDGFSEELIREYIDQLDETGAHYLKRIRQGAQDMGELIDDLLKISRISKQKVKREAIDLAELANNVYKKLTEINPEQYSHVKLRISDDKLRVNADKGLVRVMLMNLLSNALKFTSKNKVAEIQIGQKTKDGKDYFYIQDNGVGFDPQHSKKLFRAFNRLHSKREFDGSGIGLATVKRIVSLHGGEIIGEGKPGEGATFYFHFN